MTPKEIINKFNKCKTDIEKWKWVIDHQEYNILVMLDTDATYIIIDNDECDCDCEIGDFDNFIGWKDGVSHLLNAINDECDCDCDFDNFIGWKDGVSDLLNAINVKYEFV